MIQEELPKRVSKLENEASRIGRIVNELESRVMEVDDCLVLRIEKLEKLTSNLIGSFQKQLNEHTKRLDNVYSSDSNTMSNAELTASVHRIDKALDSLDERLGAIGKQFALDWHRVDELEEKFNKFLDAPAPLDFGEIGQQADGFLRNFGEKIGQQANWCKGVRGVVSRQEEPYRKAALLRRRVDKEAYS